MNEEPEKINRLTEKPEISTNDLHLGLRRYFPQVIIQFYRNVYHCYRRGERLFLDPGIQAVVLYRIGNFCYRHRIPIVSRILERTNQILTGAFIPSNVIIGKRLEIKHSVGIVIGPTAIIGDDVVILHGVTIGSVDFSATEKRHATICNGALLGAGAIILGNITIGEQARIGAGAIVTHDVPPHSTVVGPRASVLGETDSRSYE